MMPGSRVVLKSIATLSVFPFDTSISSVFVSPSIHPNVAFHDPLVPGSGGETRTI
ncbi:hypothetical protein P0D73_45040 [Paraburkholderia sp. RL18-101-BIB-B]|uniref:hypothetical protein n=1 Tax=Paraburkholderia sp. RL18-101-BIB-B TaxID=3031634 RepID=UPI0038B837BB